MSTAANIRLEIETQLASRIPGALTPRPRVIRDLAGTGVPELDALLQGGLPVGAISELTGPLSSGRTTMAMAIMAEATSAGKTVAWVDVSDTLDPESAAAAGIDLSRQLWVRCGSSQSPPPATVQPNSGQGGAAYLVAGSPVQASSGGCGSPHPRGEARGLSEAVDAFLQPKSPAYTGAPRRDRSIGTPSAPNRRLDNVPFDPRPFPRRSPDREEQIPTDRQPSRRQQLNAQQRPKASSLQNQQILNTAEAAQIRTSCGGTWHQNSANAAGRSLATPPNSIAAGLPKFRDMEARAAGQGHGPKPAPVPWQPTSRDLQVSAPKPPTSVAPTQQHNARPGEDRKKAPSPTDEPPKGSLAGAPPDRFKKPSPVWEALDQALRATDLLLSAGGFSTLVLDLGSIPAEFAWRIPLATWFRFRAAADRARTTLVLLTSHPCARSSAELVLRLVSLEAQASRNLLTGATVRVHLERRRFDTQEHHTMQPASVPVHGLHLVSARKPPQRETAWNRAAAWNTHKQASPLPTPNLRAGTERMR